MPATTPPTKTRTGFFRGLRFRLTLTNAIFLTGLLIALGFFFRGVLSNILNEQARDILNEEWGAVKGYLMIHRRQPEWRYDREDKEETFIVERLRRVYLLTDDEGQIIDHSEIFEDLGFPTPEEIKAALASKETFWEVRYSSKGEPYQIRGGSFIDDNDRTYFVAIGHSLHNEQATLDAFSRDYFLLLPLLILSGSLLGWFVAGRALNPLRQVSRAAAAITGNNLSLRLPLRRSNDELDDLVKSFNNMVERLEHSFRMTRQFSTDVSHELRTPLTAIRGQLEVALFTAETTEQYRDAIINALEDVERLSQTIRAMLLLSQAESGQLALQRAPIDLAAIVADLVDQFQIPAEEAHIQLSCAVSGPAMVNADRIQIERMVSNLLSNATKYTPGDGRVQATVRTEPEHVVFSVADTGVGIPPEYLPHIFDRFYRVPGSSKEKQGLGLGLSFVAWIVKAHGGEIDVDSQLGQGTTFTVTLPAASKPERVVNQAAAAAPGSPGNVKQQQTPVEQR